MEEQLFVPKKLKVGFQKRSDTYTKKLAYVIYYDSKNVLRKETSWQGWRDKKIAPMDVDNVPHSGFVINKDVQRNSSYFGDGGGRNMIRVYDDRGIEFEITTGNLVFILMTTNCHKRGLEGEFVYAWYGKELVLLPVGCDEYQKSLSYTSLQSGKIGVKDLIPGCSYKTKKQQDLIYLGKFDWVDSGYSSGVYCVNEKSSFIFVDEFPNSDDYEDDEDDEEITEDDFDTEKEYQSYLKRVEKEKKERENEVIEPEFIPLNSLSSFAVRNSDTPVLNYAELMDKYSKTINASKPVELEMKPLSKKIKFSIPRDSYGSCIDGDFYLKGKDGSIMKYEIEEKTDYDRKTGKNIHKGWTLRNRSKISLNKGKFTWNSEYDRSEKIYTEAQIEAMGFEELYITLENGTKIKASKYNI